MDWTELPFNNVDDVCHSRPPVNPKDLFSLLPDELKLNISERLLGDNAALAALARVSSRFTGIAEQCLYKEIFIPKCRHDQSYGNLVFLIRTLINRPDLAQKTRRLQVIVANRRSSDDIQGHHWITYTKVADLQQLFGAHMKDFVRQCNDHVRALEQSYTKPREARRVLRYWRKLLNSGVEVAHGGLLLTLLPNLAVLDFTEAAVEGRVADDLVSEAIFGVRMPYNDVWGVGDDMAPAVLQHILAGLNHVKRLNTTAAGLSLLFLEFANLETLDVELIFEDDYGFFAGYGYYESHFQPNHPHLKSLIARLDWSEIDSERRLSPDLGGLFDFLDGSTLNNLEVIFVRSPTRYEGHSTLGSFDKLLPQLRPLYQTLRRLKIDIQLDADMPHMSGMRKLDPREFNKFSPVNSLAAFTQLRTLEVFQQVLIDRDYIQSMYHEKDNMHRLLPPNIEQLTINCPDIRVQSWLDCLRKAKEHYPYLHQILLACDWRFGETATQFMHENLPVFAELEEVGITSRIFDA
ncbi:hypothetical protein BDV96DRAFT_658695 [Lophiotrema nucula]|uniref:F-box domain-containing protein n=1 Tax=Lophiotrema nucula TaxID=690887 RepID=A0A6A5ZA71_9PLEO|nr:hypothetical protein BDV96DRAFT_658695 [Lophiotrema nucula]